MFYLCHEALSGLESGYVVLGDDERGILGDVACRLLGAFLQNEGAETSEEDRSACKEGCFNVAHEGLDASEYNRAFYSRLF